MTFKFSIGDRVRVIGKDPRGLNGRVGEVLERDRMTACIDEIPPEYFVRLDGGHNWWFTEPDLEREAQPPTPAKEPT